MFEWKGKTDDYIAKFIVAMHGRLVDRQSIYRDLWSIIVRIFRPRRYDILGNRPKGEQYGADIFDQHPANALSKFVGGLLGYMVSRAVPWLQFIALNSRLMTLDHIKNYCQNASEQILYAAGRSTLYAALVPHALDAHSIGTSVMIPLRDDVKDRIVFDVVHPRDSFISINKFGDPQIYHRNLKLTRLTALDQFGQDALPTTWFDEKDMLKDPLSEQEFIWAVYPNEDRDLDSILSTDKEFAVFCVLVSSAGKKLVLKAGRDDFPICWRSLRESGAEYGTSLAADCLTGALHTNKLGEKGLMAAHLAVEPPVIASKSLRRSLHMNPRGQTWVDDIQREGAKTWLDKLNWPISDAQMERIHSYLDDRFFIRFFEMFSMGDMKERTAYEVSRMMGEKATLMGNITDTCEQESLEPAIDRLIRDETEAGRMPDVPGELLEGGGRIGIRYLGPLAQLQRSLLQSKGIVDSLDIIARVMELNENAGWKINWLELIEEATVAQGMPQKLILSDDEVKMIQERIAAERQQEQQMEMVEKGAKAASGLTKRIEPGSPLQQLLSAGQGGA